MPRPSRSKSCPWRWLFDRADGEVGAFPLALSVAGIKPAPLPIAALVDLRTLAPRPSPLAPRPSPLAPRPSPFALRSALYTAASAWSMSARKSSTCSMPIDSRTVSDEAAHPSGGAGRRGGFDLHGRQRRRFGRGPRAQATAGRGVHLPHRFRPACWPEGVDASGHHAQSRLSPGRRCAPTSTDSVCTLPCAAAT